MFGVPMIGPVTHRVKLVILEILIHVSKEVVL
jgi:hypothetical protein